MDYSIFRGSYKPEFKSKIITSNFSATPVFSPDTSYDAICNMIDSANENIYIQQLYIYKDWGNEISPFVKRLVDKSKQGIDIKVILNFNPYYKTTNEKCNLTRQYFEENGIDVKFVYTNWSIFTNIHNKGMIVDNESVLISSINWNKNSVIRNREAGIIIESDEVAQFYADVFLYDWNLSGPIIQQQLKDLDIVDYKNTIYIGFIFTMTFILIVRDWRKRKWT
jgi:phosphatidylserine/phosphatidylglycerophosphate/cardiolipin synthase-like enzyme